MSYYVEVEIHVYDQGPTTTGVGHFLSYGRAEGAVQYIEAQLREGPAKAALDAKYGEDEYSVTVLALRLRTPHEAIKEVTE